MRLLSRKKISGKYREVTVPAHHVVSLLLKRKIYLSLYIYLLRSLWLPSTIVNVSYNKKVIFFFQQQ